jgi:hypothetical protein
MLWEREELVQEKLELHIDDILILCKRLEEFYDH